ncbi:hypothetical protein BDF19DRAFT_413728 [Syncephalis fuscata]|nr:hypothetical protein BDF19DRAFT_413728 [Syncephalis fuscata]
MSNAYNERVWLVKYLEKILIRRLACYSCMFLFCRTTPMNKIFIAATYKSGCNKQIAAIAYESFNAGLNGTRLQIRTPLTKHNVSLKEIPAIVKCFGSRALVKTPYSNSSKGVYTISNQSMKHRYEIFIVQSLIGNVKWFSHTSERCTYRVGTVPDKDNNKYVYDLRVMIIGDELGYRPIAYFARRAHKLLLNCLENSSNVAGGSFADEPFCIIQADKKEFLLLGMDLNNLVDAYIQTVLSVTAIDKVC